MRPRIYISGPVTGTEDYIERFAEAERALKRKGYSVINPARVLAQLPEDTDYKGYMDMSLCMLKTADVICMLDNWEKSKGARLEHQFARTMGIEAVYERKEN